MRGTKRLHEAYVRTHSDADTHPALSSVPLRSFDAQADPLHATAARKRLQGPRNGATKLHEWTQQALVCFVMAEDVRARQGSRPSDGGDAFVHSVSEMLAAWLLHPAQQLKPKELEACNVFTTLASAVEMLGWRDMQQGSDGASLDELLHAIDRVSGAYADLRPSLDASRRQLERLRATRADLTSRHPAATQLFECVGMCEKLEAAPLGKAQRTPRLLVRLVDALVAVLERVIVARTDRRGMADDEFVTLVALVEATTEHISNHAAAATSSAPSQPVRARYKNLLEALTLLGEVDPRFKKHTTRFRDRLKCIVGRARTSLDATPRSPSVRAA